MFKTSRLVLVKVSLFNLQGTRSVRRSIDYYSTTPPLCQALFLTFFIFFRLWLFLTTRHLVFALTLADLQDSPAV